MRTSISANKKKLCHSNSSKTPFMISIDYDGTESSCYAIKVDDKEEITVLHSIQLPIFIKDSHSENERAEIKISWSPSGEHAAVIINGEFEAVLDFDKEHSYTRQKTALHNDSQWKELNLNYSPILNDKFHEELFYQKNQKLREEITKVSENNNEENRLQLFKQLMNCQLIVPIDKPITDPKHTIYTFSTETEQNILCAFSDHEAFRETFESSLHQKSIASDYLFHQLSEWKIPAVLLSNSEQKSIMIYEEEYPLISISHSAQQLSYDERLLRMSQLLIRPAVLTESSKFYKKLRQNFEELEWLMEAYFFRSTASSGGLALGVRCNKKDDKELVRLYRDILKLQKKFPDDSEDMEITVLEPNSYLLESVQRIIPAFYKAPTP